MSTCGPASCTSSRRPRGCLARRASAGSSSRRPVARCTTAATRSAALRGSGFKANYYEVDSDEEYWISGPRKDGADRLYGERVPVVIDDDVREEYWTEIRRRPERAAEADANR
jgi:hypothetical protein